MHDGCNHGHESAGAEAQATQQGGPARRAAYWRSVEQLAQTPEFQAYMHREFQEGASEASEDERRTFIKLMGASVALAGLAAAGCRRLPESKFAEYASRPANRVPGVPVSYATTFELGGNAYGVLATSYDGRPIKLDGNPAHPSAPLAGGASAIVPAELAKRGAPQVGPSSSMVQARVLELYDPERSRQVFKSGKESNLAEFEAWLADRAKALGAKQGEGLAILMPETSSPSLLDMIARVKQAFPKVTVTAWEALAGTGSLDGTRMAYGTPVRVMPQLDKATVVVALDWDMLEIGRAHV